MPKFGFRLVSISLLTGSLLSCASVIPIPCSSFGDPNLADDEIAILQLTTASLEAIDGNIVPLGRDPNTFVCSEARLHPGMHTLTLTAEMPVSELVDPTGYIELKKDLLFRAEPGRSYEVHFDRATNQEFGVSWWIVDTQTSEVVAGMSVE